MAEWRKFWRTILTSALVSGGSLLALVVLLDPYNTLPYSLPLDRYPVTTNQRFGFPAIIASQEFDSMVTGTSTARLLYPPSLDDALGGSFANLSLNSGRAYEQLQVVDLFAYHHPDMKRLVIGADSVWCDLVVDEKFTFRPFPPWLYDRSPWNDVFYLFNLETIEQSGRLLGQLLGLRPPAYGKDGYGYFLPDPSEYDLSRVRKKLYKDREPYVRPTQVAPADNYAGERAGWSFPQLEYLRTMMDIVPEHTEVIVFFVPYHHLQVPTPGSEYEARWDACKQEVADILSSRGRAHVVDFMIRSDITMEDRNYWDPLHYTRETADLLVRELETAVKTRQSNPAYYEYIGPTPAAD